VVAGEVPGRTTPEERILVRTEGLVSQDVAVSWWLYQQACARGLGLRLP
jgi:ornithine cyclodeaminase/alanine dehydrogenase-like protein (mu-crystallin family)